MPIAAPGPTRQGFLYYVADKTIDLSSISFSTLLTNNIAIKCKDKHQNCISFNIF